MTVKNIFVVGIIIVCASIAPAMPPREGIQEPEALKAMRLKGMDSPERGMERELSLKIKDAKISGSRKYPVVMGYFTDLAAINTQAEFQSMLFSNAIGTKSVNNYYRDMSYNAMSCSGTVDDWRSSNNTVAYYSVNDGLNAGTTGNTYEFIRKVLAHADSFVNFADSSYDLNHDGYVDVLWVTHAGKGAEEGASNIWSHSFYLSGFGGGATYYTTGDISPFTGNPVRINDYIINPERTNYADGNNTTTEMIGCGVYCHEFGHALGLPDLYDTDASGYGSGSGLGNWSVMASGSWGGNGNTGARPSALDVWCRRFLGWASSPLVTNDNLYTVNSIMATASGSSYKLAKLGTDTTMQYWLIENRYKLGMGPISGVRWDSLLLSSSPGGLAIYHIDSTYITATYLSNNTVNNKYTSGGVARPYGVAMEETDMTTAGYNSELWTGTNQGDAADIWMASTQASFDSSGTAYPVSYYNGTTSTTGGAHAGVAVRQIPAGSAAMACSMFVGNFTIDNIKPHSQITFPPHWTRTDVPLTITGTAVDTGSGLKFVKLSFNDGSTYPYTATGKQNWSLVWPGGVFGTCLIKSMATDSIDNNEIPSSAITVFYDTTCPTAYVTSPVEGGFITSAAGDSIAISGRASDIGNFSNYTLAYKQLPSGSWQVIKNSAIPLVDSILGWWNLTSLSDGYDSLKLTVNQAVGSSSAYAIKVCVDRNGPVAPTSCMAISQPAGKINLFWPSVIEAKTYKIYRDTISTVTIADTLIRQNLTSTNFTDSTGASGILYYYAVACVDSAGNQGALSPVGSAWCDAEAPAVPALSLPANNVWTNNLTPAFVWQRTTDVGGTGVSRYYVRAAGDSTFMVSVWNDSTVAGSGNDTTKASAIRPVGTNYWQVRAKDVAGNYGNWAAFRTVRIDTAKPNAPALAMPVSGWITINVRPSFTWRTASDLGGSGVQLYKVEAASDAGFTSIDWSDTTGGMIDTVRTPSVDLPEGPIYWRVSTKDSAGNWTANPQVSSFRIDLSPPLAPASIVIQSQPNGRINLTWAASASSDRSYYKVYRDTNLVVTVSDVLVGSGVFGMSLTDSTGASGILYYYAVACVDSAGNQGALSPVGSAWCDAEAPVTPSLISPAITTWTYDLCPNLTWNKSNDLGGSGFYKYFVTIASDTNLISIVWQDSTTVGTINDTAKTCGINLVQNAKYYWSVTVRDYAGNYCVNPQISWFRILVTPRLANTSPNPGSSINSIAMMSFTFTNPMTPATFNANNIVIAGRNNPREFWWAYNNPARTLTIKPDIGFASWDTVTITLKNALQDSFGAFFDGNANGLNDGSPADDYVWTGYVSMLGDFSGDNKVGVDDVPGFGTAWNTQDTLSEMGPAVGALPYLSPISDGKINIEDLMAFTRMYNWSFANQTKEAKSDNAQTGENPGPFDLIVTGKPTWPLTVGQEITLSLNGNDIKNLMAATGSICYDKNELQLMEAKPGIALQSKENAPLYIAAADTLNGELHFGASRLDQYSPEYSGSGAVLNIKFIALSERPQNKIAVTISGKNIKSQEVCDGNSSWSIESLFKPKMFALGQSFPNPARDRTVIQYQLPRQTQVSLKVYNVLGQEVKTLVNSAQGSGYYNVEWNGKNNNNQTIAAGVYMYRLKAGDFEATKKMVIIR